MLDAATGTELAAARAFLRVLDGSCKTPVGGHAQIEGDRLAFHAIVLKPDGSQFFATEVSGPMSDAVQPGETAGERLAVQIPAGFFDP